VGGWSRRLLSSSCWVVGRLGLDPACEAITSRIPPMENRHPHRAARRGPRYRLQSTTSRRRPGAAAFAMVGSIGLTLRHRLPVKRQTGRAGFAAQKMRLEV